MSQTQIVERLERLERAYRRLKGFALAALVQEFLPSKNTYATPGNTPKW